ncbi:hypothetical protein F5880DRAFT_1705712 [Lentinula raphanica]|nr:hypothetical protein F5880DRAFT_1705712 [Lentinula raphanica]
MRLTSEDGRHQVFQCVGDPKIFTPPSTTQALTASILYRDRLVPIHPFLVLLLSLSSTVYIYIYSFCIM